MTKKQYLTYFLIMGLILIIIILTIMVTIPIERYSIVGCMVEACLI